MPGKKSRKTEKSAEIEELNGQAASEAETVVPDESPNLKADLNGDGVVDKGEAEIDAELQNIGSQNIAPPKKHKLSWLGYVFLCAIIALGIYMIFKISEEIDGDAKSLTAALAGGDWVFGLISVGVLLVIVICEWMKYSVVMKTTTGKFNFRSSLKVGLLGKFYDNVTPFAVGGQPMQIYYLHKKGFSGGVSSAVILIKYFAQMFCYTIVSLILMACNTGVLSRIDPIWTTIITVGAWLGLFVNMFLPLMIVTFAIVPKFARKLVSIVVGAGAKLKIVKDKQATTAKAENVVSDFRAGFKIMSKKPFNLIALLFFCLLEVLLTFSLPYFIMQAYSTLPADGGFELYLTVVALNVYCTQAVTVIPTPGNAGIIEGVLVNAYRAIAVSALSWALVSWRFAVYYIYLVIGLCLVVYELIRKIYRARKAKKAAQAASLPTDEPLQAETCETTADEPSSDLPSEVSDAVTDQTELTEKIDEEA